MRSYEFLIIGTGPAGVQAALRARRSGRKTAVVERMSFVGGTCIHRGTIPSKTLRQVVIDLSGFRHWGLYQTGPVVRPRLPMAQLRDRCDTVVATEVAWQERLLRSRGIEVIRGLASFTDSHNVVVKGHDGSEEPVRGEKILLAVGSTPLHPESVPFDGRRVLDSDQILDLDELPRSLTIVGGGVIGSEYAAIFSLLDVDVTLVNRAPRLMPFVDESIIAELERAFHDRAVTIAAAAEVESIELVEDAVRTTLADGRTIETEALLYCAGRTGAAPAVALENAGLAADSRGRVEVDKDFRTAVPHIFAAGDVIGFPSLASAAREQGRVAACRAFEEPCRPVEELIPYGVYTIPEIAMVGPPEQELREAGVDYETGIGLYEDTARGQIIGDTEGLLKLIVAKESRQLLSAHLIGTGAAELVHLAQMAIAAGLPYTWFIRSVMNYPTLARVYKLAAWDLLEKLGD